MNRSGDETTGRSRRLRSAVSTYVFSQRTRRSRLLLPSDLTRDPLTGLLDHGSFDRAIVAATELAARSSVEVSLLKVRVTRSPEASTAQIAGILVGNLRSIDVIGALDDGAFGAVLETSVAGALRAGSRIRTVLRTEHPRLATWVGGATASGPGIGPDRLSAAADAALARAEQEPWGWVDVSLVTLGR